MNKLYLKMMLGALIVSVLFLVRTPAAEASGNVRITSTATLDQYTAYDSGSCDPNTLLPYSGDPACVSTVGEI
jgi:hypothetical protein